MDWTKDSNRVVIRLKLNDEKYFIENYCRIKAPNGKLYTINYNSYKIKLNNILNNINKNEKRRHRNH